MKKLLLSILLIIFIFMIIINNKETIKTENKIQESIKEENYMFDLNNKNVALIGDSLIEGYGNEFKGLDYYLKLKFPLANFENKSKSGSTVSENTGDDEIVIKNQIKNIKENPDVILFNGGANDVMGYAFNFLNNDLKKEIGNLENSQYQDSVISDFEKIILELNNKFPNAEIYYVQIICLDDETISNLVDNEEKANEIRQRRDLFFKEAQKVCEKYGVKYVDVSNIFYETGLEYRQDDWVHIKEKGYMLLVDELINNKL